MLTSGKRQALVTLIIAFTSSWGFNGACASNPVYTLPRQFSVQPKPDYVLEFYLTDNLLTPTNASSFIVLPPIGFNPVLGVEQSFFGGIVVFDDSMTVGPDPLSTEVGRGKGFYIFDSLTSKGVEMIFTAVFSEASGLKGSTLTFRGNDEILNEVRKIVVCGGTGKFVGVRGYAEVRTFSKVEAAAVLRIKTFLYR